MHLIETAIYSYRKEKSDDFDANSSRLGQKRLSLCPSCLGVPITTANSEPAALTDRQNVSSSLPLDRPFLLAIELLYRDNSPK